VNWKTSSVRRTKWTGNVEQTPYSVERGGRIDFEEELGALLFRGEIRHNAEIQFTVEAAAVDAPEDCVSSTRTISPATTLSGFICRAQPLHNQI
jgi:hypothetical protein